VPVSRTWVTRYQRHGRTWGAWVVAPTVTQARRILKVRGMGETLVGELVGGQSMDTWAVYRKRRSLTVRLHYLTFLAMVAAHAHGGVGAAAALSDVGWFHEWVHQVSGIEGVLTRGEVESMIYRTEEALGFVGVVC
jgi:hypothetical protein